MDRAFPSCQPGSRSVLCESRKPHPLVGVHACLCVSVRAVCVSVCVCVNTHDLSSLLLTILVTQLWAKPPFKCGTRYRHRAFWGCLPTAPLLASVGTSPEILLHPSPRASPDKQSWRPCSGGSQLSPVSSPGTITAFTSLGLTHGAGEQRPHVCRLPFKTKHPNRETTSPPLPQFSLLVSDSDMLKGSSERTGVGRTASQGDN